MIPAAPAAPLLERIERMGASGALRVAQVCADDRAQPQHVADALAADPARAANSSFYGLSGRVGDLRRAVLVVGFRGVQGVATLAATGVDGGADPAWWRASARTAAAARLLAPRFDVPAQEAFAAGLLADVGVALLRAHDPAAAVHAHGPGGLEAERETFGVDHVELVVRLAEAFLLPPALTDGVAEHHSPRPLTAPGRCLATSVALGDGRHPSAVELLAEGAVVAGEVEALVEDVDERAEALARALAG